jgi:hypothetical protein
LIVHNENKKTGLLVASLQRRAKTYQERGESLLIAPGFAYKIFSSALRLIIKKICAHWLISDFTLWGVDAQDAQSP